MESLLNVELPRTIVRGDSTLGRWNLYLTWGWELQIVRGDSTLGRDWRSNRHGREKNRIPAKTLDYAISKNTIRIKIRPLFLAPAPVFSKKAYFPKILLRSLCAARLFKLFIFTENGRKRALFGSFWTRKRLQTQPTRHSHLSEPLHVDIKWKLGHFW